MLDLIYILATLGFFLIAGLFGRALERFVADGTAPTGAGRKQP
jgi:hypothetical protein